MDDYNIPDSPLEGEHQEETTSPEMTQQPEERKYLAAALLALVAAVVCVVTWGSVYLLNNNSDTKATVAPLPAKNEDEASAPSLEDQSAELDALRAAVHDDTLPQQDLDAQIAELDQLRSPDSQPTGGTLEEEQQELDEQRALSGQ